ncbi:hypothetical protein BCR41DRAFT_350155 [Lobosporangium transversale]|uniref:Uncharacterized protein n=1 Tax=Lobosporangium transversale TaxID=64571 RepID=A0A1Y2GSS2_9FUNG|nr:hypothetical protein BCR41DRAFT_350155 [Lobosporangium transversale]ORZ21871.1 hypothetical protein BCR41DRAFT_350155 [Lobosporangium transversale]|eukprot:XP_021883122.1 hypothetical protein BCR41DRAFT_350155 [Lobosporangium transversale]
MLLFLNVLLLLVVYLPFIHREVAFVLAREQESANYLAHDDEVKSRHEELKSRSTIGFQGKCIEVAIFQSIDQWNAILIGQ